MLKLVVYVPGVEGSGISIEARGQRLVAQVEYFRSTKGRLPSDTTEMGIKQTLDGPLFYEKKDDDSYIVYYGLQLGKSMVYDSKTRAWEARY